MTPTFGTAQEDFWAGDFGDDYTERNDGPALIASNIALFARVLAQSQAPASVIELGANRGLNLHALRALLPAASLTAVEINPKAAERLRSIAEVQVIEASLLDWQPAATAELVFTKGVLIHIAPEKLPIVYDLMMKASSRYIFLAEYYSPSPAEIPYRGHAGRLFKRDFAGELLDRHPGLRVVDHGFAWRRDPFPQDDLNWFLMEKRTAKE